MFLGEDSKDSPDFSHLQAPCFFKVTQSHLTSLSGKVYHWKSSSWSVLTKMSLLVQNILCHIWYQYLKPNHFLVRYDGCDFLASFHFLLICKKMQLSVSSFLIQVESVKLAPFVSRFLECATTRFSCTSYWVCQTVVSVLWGMWSERIPVWLLRFLCWAPGHVFAHQHVCCFTHRRDSLCCFALKCFFLSPSNIKVTASF